jgi:hypothetical protein
MAGHARNHIYCFDICHKMVCRSIVMTNVNESSARRRELVRVTQKSHNTV